jgi:hypothetical protein
MAQVFWRHIFLKLHMMTRYLVLFSLFLSCCKQENKLCCVDNYKGGFYPAGIDTFFRTLNSFHVELKEQMDTTGLYLNMGFQIYTRNDSPYVVYANNKRDFLVFHNLLEPKHSKHISLRNILAPEGRYTWKIHNDTAHFIELSSKIYSSFIISDTLGFKKLRIADLSSAFAKHMFLNSNVLVDEKLEYFHPWIFVQYGTFKTETNIGDKVLLKINVHTKKAERIMEYSDLYKNCPPRTHHILFTRSTENSLDVIFKKENAIYNIDLDGRIKSKSSKVTFPSAFMCFDRSLQKNLAYTAKYEQNDEENINLISVGDKKILVKRLRKDSRSASDTTALLIFDRNLSYNGIAILKEKLYSRISFPYKSGVLIINDSLTKANYYGF